MPSILSLKRPKIFLNIASMSMSYFPCTNFCGPPFATGTPHYGHILISVLKDVVVRYFTMKGHYIPRRFGFDCHGLPIEHEVDKLYGIHGEADVQKLGIDKYNDICRSIVMRCRDDWEHVISRIGRWIEFKNDYKTMDPSFMESVWWVFSELWKKELVYRGTKVMPWSTGLQTSLSNFEANQNYKEVEDPAIFVTFPLVDEPEVSLVAWTTTPWTLPSNLALVVHPEFDYVRIRVVATGAKLILAQCRLEALYPAKKAKKGETIEPEYEIEATFPGSILKGKHYIPLFHYFENRPNSFKILCDTFVTSDAGTGVVHAAPGFGEDDSRVCADNGVVSYDNPTVCPIDGAGRFTKEVSKYEGIFVKEADKMIMAELKANGRLLLKTTCRHSYPFCWRSDTPLLYRAVPSWFVRVTAIKDKLLENNMKSAWVPENVQEGRFHNWLRDSRDWAISRSRFFGTPLPVWTNEDFSEVVCVESIEHLYQLSGVRVADLHRDHVDSITIPSVKNPEGPALRRIPEVFDCWFESGSMPYASEHYPFNNPESWKESFPADFVAEAIDQTRGWFYTMLVLSTALFDSPPYKNLVVTGLILAEDGRKMSKRLKNYPDPLEVVKDHGADALRLYLINSPVMRAESLRFRKAGVESVVRDVIIPYYNTFKFLMQNIQRFELSEGKFVPCFETASKSSNIFDKWIISALYTLIAYVKTEMEAYRVYSVVPKVLDFITQLSNWYVRLNRDRLRGKFGVEDCMASLQTLFHVVYNFNLTLAPFACFITESVYQEMKPFLTETEQSVHFLPFPTVQNISDPLIEKMITRMQDVIIRIRTLRDKNKLPVKQALSEAVIIHTDEDYLRDIKTVEQYILSESNLISLNCTSNEGSYVALKATANFKSLGPRLGKNMKKAGVLIANMTHDQIVELRNNSTITLDGLVFTPEDVMISRNFVDSEQSQYDALPGDEGVLCLLNIKVTRELIEAGLVREVVSNVQKMRKNLSLVPSDLIEVFVESSNEDLVCVLKSQSLDSSSYVYTKLGCSISKFTEIPSYMRQVGETTIELDNSNLRIVLCSACAIVSEAVLKQNPKVAVVLPLLDYSNVAAELKKGSLALIIDGQEVVLSVGTDVFASMFEFSRV
ncbi:hypothetical protein RCL1_001499 [Eukaryota sp. TZLM3-RCL]